MPEALAIAGGAIDRALLTRALEAGTTHFAPGEILRGTDLRAMARAADRMFARLDAVLDELAAGAPDFAVAHGRIRDLVAELAGGYLDSDAMISGTLTALPRIAMFFGFRIADPAIRRALFDRYMAEFRAVSRAMAERTRALFAELDGKLGWASFAYASSTLAPRSS